MTIDSFSCCFLSLELYWPSQNYTERDPATCECHHTYMYMYMYTYSTSACMYYHIHNYEFYYRYYYCTFQISTIHNFTNSMGQMSLLGQLLHVRRHLSKDIIQLHGIYTKLHVVHYVFILMVSLLIVANLLVFILQTIL